MKFLSGRKGVLWIPRYRIKSVYTMQEAEYESGEKSDLSGACGGNAIC